jgi:DNA-binding beta-propeller fold protein YncE
MARPTTSVLLLAGLLLACSKQNKEQASTTVTGNYPAGIATIILSKCATTGCHNDASSINAGGLNLSAWEKMFSGAGTGAVVIPYRPDFSTLCYYTNTDSSLELALQPTMPYGGAPLSKEEYQRLRDWIANGAPSAEGRIMFADSVGRRKFYVANRLCDVVTIIDADSLLQMRYADAGNASTAKFPYRIRVTPDKTEWYVAYYTRSGILSKYNGTTDTHTGDIFLGEGTWQSFDITRDGKYAWAADNSNPGRLAHVNLKTGALISIFEFGGQLIYPSSVVTAGDRLFITPSSGNFIYQVDVADAGSPSLSKLPIDGSATVSLTGGLNPVDLLYESTGERIYVLCAATTDMRIVDAATGKLLYVVKLPGIPAALAFSPKKRLLFVSCPDDVTTFPGNRGSVAVIDVSQPTIVTAINTGYQPYGLAVDDELGLVAVANANISAGGPASHHESGCGKTNGNVTFISTETLTLVAGKKLEVAVFPYAVGH